MFTKADLQAYKDSLQWKSSMAKKVFSNRTVARTLQPYAGGIQVYPQLMKESVKLDKPSMAFHYNETDKGISKMTEKYLSDYNNTPGKLQMFMKDIQFKTQQFLERLKSFTLQDAYLFLPWVMSNIMLVQPIRTMLYCLATGKEPTGYLYVRAILTSNALNEQVNSVIVNNIRGGGTECQTILQILKNVMLSQSNGDMVVKSWTEWLSKSNALSLAIKDPLVQLNIKTLSEFKIGWVKQLFKEINIMTVFDIFNLKNFTQQLNDLDMKFEPINTADAKLIAKYLHGIYSAIFNDMRIFGTIPINMAFVRARGVMKYINGKTVYFFPENPTLFISLTSSMVGIYRKINADLIPIAESSFDMEYLRNLISGQVVNFTQGIYQSISNDLTLTKNQKQSRQEFVKTYLGNETQDQGKVGLQVNRENFDEIVKLLTRKLK